MVRKEFRHIFRDRVSCMLLFLMPAFIMLIFGYALAFDVYRYDIQVCNPGHSVQAERLFARLDAHPKFRVTGRLERIDAIDGAFARGNNRAVVVYRDDGIDLFVDATSPTLSTNLTLMLSSVTGDFAADEFHLAKPSQDIRIRYLYNPTLKKEYMPIPGLVMLVFILVSSIVLGTSINKEKAQGSFRLLRLTRMSNLEIIAGKSAPYFLITLLHVAVVYLICLYFGVRVEGSLALFFALCTLYSVCCMSLGILIASWFDRPLDVLIICWIFLFIPNVFLSGFIFPIETMDPFMHAVARLLPGTAFIDAFRSIAFKGTGLGANLPAFGLLAGETVLAGFLSLIGFKRNIPR